MTPGLIVKALEQIECARDCLDQGQVNSAVDRAYYAMYNIARAFLAHEGVEVHGSHGSVVQLFGRHAVKGRGVDPLLGRSLNRTMEARSIADYSADAIPSADATDYVRDAERFFDTVVDLIPVDRRPPVHRRGQSQRQKFDEMLLRRLCALACQTARSRGEDISLGTEETLFTESTVQEVEAIIVHMHEHERFEDVLRAHAPSMAAGPW